MSRNKDNKKKSYKGLVVAIDSISIGIVIACILMDTLWINNIEYELVSVSIDSFLALIAILSSFVIPYAENRTYQKYNLSNDDLNNIRGDTKTIYINLLVASIIMFAADAIFYMFDLALSLFGVIVVGLLFICVFVAPRIEEYAKGEDAIIEMVQEKTIEYIDKNSADFNPSEKLIVSILLEKGFDNTISLIKDHKIKKKEQDKFPSSSDIFVFLISEENKYMQSLTENPNIDSILTNKIIRELLTNVFSLFSVKSLKMLDELDMDKKYDAYHQTSSSLSLLDKLVVISKFESDFQKQLSTTMLTTIKRTYDRTGEKNISYLYLLCFLFSENFNKDNLWFVNAFIELFFGKKRPILNSVDGRAFASLMYFELIGIDSPHTLVLEDNDFSDYIESALKDKEFIFVRRLFISSHSTDTFFCHLSSTYSECLEIFNQIDTNTHFRPSNRRFFDVYKRTVPKYILYTLSINYYSNIEEVDDLFYEMSPEEKNFVIEQSDFALRDFGNMRAGSTHFLRMLNSNLSREDLEEARHQITGHLQYFSDYNRRRKIYDSFKEGSGLNSYLSNFNTFVKSFPEYEETLDLSKTNVDRHYINPSRRYFPIYIRKDTHLSDLNLEKYSLDFSSLLGRLISFSFHDFAFNYSEISNYDSDVANSILAFNPKYKNAPKFDEYCKDNDIQLGDCIDSTWFRLGKDGEIFAQEGVIKFRIEISDFIIREINISEAKDCFRVIDNLDDLPPIITNASPLMIKDRNYQKGTEEDYQRIKGEYYLVTFYVDLENSVYINQDKVRIINIPTNLSK